MIKRVLGRLMRVSNMRFLVGGDDHIAFPGPVRRRYGPVKDTGLNGPTSGGKDGMLRA